MSLLMEVIVNNTVEDKRKELVKRMVERGQQVPLVQLIGTKEIQKLVIKEHVLFRFKQRFEKLYDIEIENMIKKDLISHAMVVEKGHSNRWKVHSKGMIFLLDEDAVYTTYDANGNDNNNIIDPTKATLRKIEKKSRKMDRINHLFDLINNDNPTLAH